MTTAIAALPAADIAAIEATVDPWRTACIERDWDAALDMCTDDCVFLPPGMPSVPPDGLRAFFEAYPEIKAFTFRYDHIEGRDDLATARGGFEMTVVQDGVETSATGKFLDIFRKGDDGVWRYSTIAWNHDA